ncbi:MAG TPA: SBBP repeat-containing protein [Verrucomicrobiae bacterium]|nr:SBBP repeat-containing protein [Verrucomicrobiae bacterium]
MSQRTLISIVASLLLGLTSYAQERPTAPSAAFSPRLPLTFEANRGQSASQVNFLSRGNGYTAFLSAGSVALSLHPDHSQPSDFTGSKNATNQQARAVNLQFSLVGSSKAPLAIGEGIQVGKVNYFFGNDPNKWITNVPTYSSVHYKDVYPDVDLVYYGHQRQMEYDFIVQPGADPRSIQIEVTGGNALSLDGDGNLALTAGTEQVRLQRPILYQIVNGQRAEVDGGYVMLSPTRIGFRVSSYDRGKALIIDPVLVYSTYLGGSGIDQSTGLAVDSTGNIYVVGYANAADFTVTQFGTVASGSNHVFVVKLDSTGSNLLYADYIGGNSDDYGVGLALDAANEVYLTGSTTSSNFPVANAFQAQQPGPYTGFISKLSANGASLLFSTYVGGNAFDQPTGIAIDPSGDVTIAGYTMSQNFPVGNAYQSTVSPNQGGAYGYYGFLTKFTSNGSSLVFSTYLSGSTTVAQNCGSPCYPMPFNTVNALAVDSNGNAYVAGTTNTNNYPTSEGSYQPSNLTTQDANIGFISKFNSTGGLGYSTYFYPSSGNPVQISAAAVDSNGSLIFAGSAQSDGTFPVTSASTAICDPSVYGYNCSSAFTTKLDPTGSTLLYSTFLGPNNFATPAAIALDGSDNAYILSSTSSPLYQTTNAIESYSNNSDLLLVEIDAAADTQLFSTYLGGNGNDSPSGIAVDGSGNIYLAGVTNSTDLPITAGAFQTQFGGNLDTFLAKISPAESPGVVMTPLALQYPVQQVGVATQAQQVTLRNMGSATLTISSTSVSGDFSESDNCEGSVPAAGSCVLNVTFTPSTAGLRTGSVSISDNAPGSPHTIGLSGTGAGPAASLSTAALAFPNVSVGNSSSPLSVTVTNSGTTTLNIGSIQVSGDYTESNNCGATLAISSSCSVNVIFTPSASGSRSGTLTLTDSAMNSPQTVGLSGRGTDFTITATSDSATVNPGSTATYNVSVSAVGGSFSSAVALSCTGAPALTTCSLSPSSVTPGASSASVTVTVSTTSTSASALTSPKQPTFVALWMQLPGLGFFGIVLGAVGRKKKHVQMFLGVLCISALLFLSGCAGGTGIAKTQPGTNPGTYTVTVAGTSGTLQHSLPLTLTVQ